MNDAGLHLHLVDRGKPCLDFAQQGQQAAERKMLRVVMDLQRADTRRKIDQPSKFPILDRQHQRVDAESQFEVEDERAVFDEEIAVALSPVDDERSVVGSGYLTEHGVVRTGIADERSLDGAQCLDARRLVCLRLIGDARIEPDEFHPVSGAELTHLPVLGLDDRHWADEAAEARAVGTEDHRHVAGEIDRADRIGVVVDVGWVKTRFAAIGPRPFRLRADQADAGAVGIVVDLPIGGEEGGDVLFGEEVRRAVRPVENADLPGPVHLRNEARRHRQSGRPGTGIEMENVSRQKGAAAMPAEFAEGEGRLRAQIVRHLKAARNGQIGARAAAGDAADFQQLSGIDRNRLPERDQPAHRASPA